MPRENIDVEALLDSLRQGLWPGAENVARMLGEAMLRKVLDSVADMIMAPVTFTEAALKSGAVMIMVLPFLMVRDIIKEALITGKMLAEIRANQG